MRTIKLTDEQADLLERLLEHEMDDEFIYQAEGSASASHYEAVLGIYKAVYKPAGFAIGTPSVIRIREDELSKLKALAAKKPQQDDE